MDKRESIKLKALSDIASIDITLEFDNILHEILKITCETMNAHSGTIMLVDEHTKELKMVSSYGLPDDYIQRVYAAARKAGVPITSSPSGAVLRTGNYYLVPNIFKEPKDRPWFELTRQIGFSAQLFTPLKQGLKVIGLLNIYMEKVHDFTEEEINFVTIAASQASSVVQNAKMCMKLKNNIQELSGYKEHLEGKVKETYKALFYSERYLRTIIDSSIDGIAVIDDQGKIEFGNDSFFNIVGWPRDELLGQSFLKMLTDDTKELYLKIWREYSNSSVNTEKNTEARIITKNGEIRYLFKSRAEIVINGVKKFVFIAKDITEQKSLQLQLIESEARYRELFENALDPMYTHDMRGFFVSVNKAGLEQLGCRENDEVIGTHISKWLTGESYKLVEERFKKINSGEPLDQPVIIEVICKNGEHKWGEIRTNLIRQGNQIIGTYGIARDITEKKILEQQLRESEEKYRDLFENAQDPMYTIDTNGYFLALNNAGLKLLGATRDEAIRSNLSDWFTHESMAVARERIGKYSIGESIGPFVYEIVRKDGEHIWIEVNNRFIKKGKMITSIHGIARDVTEKIRLEQKVREYHEKLEKSFEELREADRIKTEFISNITHELLTPLTSIRGYGELLDDETMGKVNPEQKKSLEIILRNSDRLIKLIKELLDTSNLNDNKLGLQFRPVSLNNVLLRSIQEIFPQVKDKQITLIRDIRQLPEIWGDEERLAQVVMNLLINAVKFTPEKGKITIIAAADTEHIKISISDTGIGIPEDKLKSIFDRFYQVDGSSSRRYGGVGLGLSICKSIIDKHYGSIWAQSDGKGSTFHIVLPRLRQDSGENDV